MPTVVSNLCLNVIKDCHCEVGGRCMCKEMPVIPVDRVVDKKRIFGKMEG
jgi:hypothetical protein